MGHALDDEQATSVASVRERVSEGLRGLFQRVERTGESIAAGAAKSGGRAAEAAVSLRRSAPLRHGLAAIERGNLDAALALLLEAVALAPEDGQAVLALWNVALACERPEVAASAMAHWIHCEASSGRRDLAAAHWVELAAQAPDEPVDVPTLVRILPELRQRLASAQGAEARGEAESWLRRALRAGVASDARELTPGLALRIFEQARFFDADTARRAGEIVLASSDLHETKRQHVQAQLDQLDATRADVGHGASARDLVEATPVELSEHGLIVNEVESGQRTRIDLRSVEAIAVVRVDRPDAEPAQLIDLVLRRTARRPRMCVVRMRPDAFDPGAVLSDSAPGDDPLGGLLGALLDRSGAIPLPDPDSALGIEPRRFESIEAYEEAVLERAATH